MVYRIFGRKKSGKTEYIYAAMQKHIENGKKCFLIVPEQQTLQTERELLKRFGNSVNLNVETVSFTRLCNRVFRETGGLSQKYIDDAGRLLVMAETLLKLQPSLREYKDCAENAEFSKTVINILDEFKKYNIENQKIEDTLKLLERNNDEKILYNKLSDIFLIGSSYKNLLRKNFNDRGDDLDRLSLVLKDYNFFAGTEVFIDSFYGFTPQELKIILNILRQAENTYVTFLCEQNSKDAIFGRGISASSEISGLCRKHGLEFCDETVNYISAKPQLQYLEENFRTENCIIARNIQASGNNGDIRIISCKNAFSEANAAACIISRLVRDGAKYKDIAVCARNIVSYEGIIDAVLQRDKIPFTFNVREDLQTKSVCAFIISAFEFIFAFRSDFLIKHIKTGLTKLTDEECDILECYIRTWNISGKKTIFSDWCMNPDGYTETFDEKAEKLLNKINIAKEKVLPQLEAFCEDVKDSRTVKDIARAVYRFIEWSESENSNFSEEDAEYRNFVVRALNQMVLVLGNESISASQFLEYFKLVISNYTVAQIPECVDSVYIGSAELMRTGNIKYMIILGCNGGIFPNTDFEEGIFSDREKKKLGGLGIEISACLQEKIYDEFFIAYNAMCEPAEKLFVLYSENDIDGSQLKKSVFVSMICKMFPDICEESFPFVESIENISSEKSALDCLFTLNDGVFASSLKKYFAKNGGYENLLKNLENENMFPGKLSEDISEEMFSDEIYASPSRIEKYCKCRFSCFGNYILGIQGEKKAELDVRETGIVSHKVLEIFVKELVCAKTKNIIYDKKTVEKRINELLSQYFLGITNGEIQKSIVSKRFLYLYNRLSGTLVSAAKVLTDEISQSEFLPVDFEVSIGQKENSIAPVPIKLPFKKGVLKVVGTFDRADIYKKDNDTYVRIIDYKTGSKKFSKDDAQYGINLQMLLYLYSIIFSESKRYGKNVKPAGVLYLIVKRPAGKANLGDDIGKTLEKTEENSFCTNGIVLDNPEIIYAMEKEQSGKYIPVKQNAGGTYSKNSSIISSDEMMKLLNDAADASAKLMSELKGGHIEINPYKCDKINSCAYCDLNDFCRLEKKNENTRYNLESLLSDTEEEK